MISYLSGKIVLKKEKFIVLDVGGVGYKIFLSKKTLEKISENDKSFEIFCYLCVRENALDLYGFLDFKELEFFELLIGISGVGPKMALEISSLGPLEKLRKEIEYQHEDIFSGVLGIGKKKARTIILELSGKLKEISKEKIKKIDEAENALANLGFSRQKAKEALSQVPEEIKAPEKRIKQALKILGK
ncbi:Holliday junction branch migration protein RuvA [Candidatus Parcubacteria bacterium]|nr:Holliday junction branch migration protein RuvA [Candidatus Parcubacteria bacterium]